MERIIGAHVQARMNVITLCLIGAALTGGNTAAPAGGRWPGHGCAAAQLLHGAAHPCTAPLQHQHQQLVRLRMLACALDVYCSKVSQPAAAMTIQST